MADGWQWFGLWTTVAGTLAGVAGLAASVVAARRAGRAQIAAEEARSAALAFGRGVRLATLAEELSEVQVLLNASVPSAVVSATINRIAGGLIRFAREHQGSLIGESDRKLKQCLTQLAVMQEDLYGRLTPASRERRLRKALALALRHLNEIRGDEQRDLIGRLGPGGAA